MGRRGNNEGTIAKRADGRWVAAVSLSDGRRKWLYGKTRAEVGVKLTTTLKVSQDNLPLPPERETVEAFLKRWLVDVAKPAVRPSTYASYEALVRLHLVPGLGKIPLARLSPQHVQTLLNQKRDKGLSPRRVQYLRAVLRNALNQALRWGLVGRNAAALANPPKMERYQIQPWTPEQARQFLDFTTDDRLHALYVLALATGARQGELLALHWPDVDLENGQVHIRGTLQRIDGQLQVCEPKTERARRTIALPPSILTVLRAHRLRQLEEQLAVGPAWRNTGFVFTTALGAPLDGGSVTHRFQKLAGCAGLPRQRFHDLRHCTATFLLAQGVAARVVMEILGHSQISLTLNTYSHVIPSLQRDAAERLGALLAGDR